jgi:cytochrome P450
MHPHFQGLTMEIILRAVFGLGSGRRLDALRETLTEMLEFGLSPMSLMPAAQRAPFGRGPWARFRRARARADELIYAEIAERRAGGAGGADILAALLTATHEDDSPMSDEEIHDELLTLLVAGHETTTTSLAWALERLGAHPRILARLVDEIDADREEDYLTATIQETLRRRPVLINAAPRTVKQPIEVGGISYPLGVHLFPSAWLVQHDPEIYPEPYEFRPERFLDEGPGTYTWIPFGGGRRRCIGANFALMEMRVVLRELLRARVIEPASGSREPMRRRAITVAPARGGTVSLGARAGEREQQPAVV